MRKFFVAGLVLVAAIAGAGFALLRNEALLLDVVGGLRPDMTISERERMIAPHIRLEASPEVAGSAAGETSPLPAVIMFHGCSGYRPAFMAQWGAVAAEAGWRAFSVDSHAPRGIDRDAAMAKVCQGKALLGQERAGDAIAAVNLVAARADVDPARIVVAGWSHGAWTLMDLFAMDIGKRAPASLKHDGVAAPQIAGAILFYPYCGFGAWSRVQEWTISPPAIAFVGGRDTVVDGPACKATFERLAAVGADIDLVFYPDAEHVFDDPTLPEYYGREEASDARARFKDFLGALR
ncbi:MAG: hypothetical protein GC152_02025 [Alphaproteobacteria bacterium]|nr:hypothetical protein [Alphaproteobacteria bacterium]